MANVSLKSMASDVANTGVGRADLFKITPSLLKEEEGFNLRDYNDPDVIAHIERLAQIYMAGDTVLPPLVVRTADDGSIYVVEGHCRRRAALLAIERGAEIDRLPCINFRGNDSDRIQYMLGSAEGLSLKPLEVAQGYKRLSNMGFNLTEIAKRVHKTPSHVEQMLLLANANSDIHRLVKSGAVSPTLAIETVRKMGEDAGKFLESKLTEAAASGKRTVTNKAIKPWTPPKNMVVTALDSVKSLTEHIPDMVKEQLNQWKEAGDDLSTLKVSVSASDLAALLAIAEEIETKRPVPKNKDKTNDEVTNGDHNE